jgi:hypothetical protein
MGREEKTLGSTGSKARRRWKMFVLTETFKAVQNSDSVVTVVLLGIVAVVCFVLLVWSIVDGRR